MSDGDPARFARNLREPIARLWALYAWKRVNERGFFGSEWKIERGYIAQEIERRK